jgi:hypothetical protein
LRRCTILVLPAAALVLAACGGDSSKPQPFKSKNSSITATIAQQCHSQTTGNHVMVLKVTGLPPKGRYTIKALYPPLQGSRSGDPRLPYVFISKKHRFAKKDGTAQIKWNCGYGQGSKPKHHVPDPVGDPYTMRITAKKTKRYVEFDYPVLAPEKQKK